MTHRFYSGDTKDRAGKIELTQSLWVNDQKLAHQIIRVLRLRVGETLVLFDGLGKEVLYRITEIEPAAVHLERVTDNIVIKPSKTITLAWALLKKDKNEWVLQKATELGVTHFVPLITERTEKLGFDTERARSIVVEASEQCGRHDIPTIQEPALLRDFIGQHEDSTQIYIADMGGEAVSNELDRVIVIVGPEGGWSEAERDFFREREIPTLGLGNFTLRAETACITAVARLQHR